MLGIRARYPHKQGRVRLGARFRGNERNPSARYGTGSAVVDLIFSMAKREVTLVSGTAPIRRL
jgi:hypothetical protein